MRARFIERKDAKTRKTNTNDLLKNFVQEAFNGEQIGKDLSRDKEDLKGGFKADDAVPKLISQLAKEVGTLK